MQIDWTQHTPYHWQTRINGEVLDFWPSKQKYRWRGETISGGERSIRKLMKSLASATERDDPPNIDELSAHAWWGWQPIGDGVSVYIIHEGLTPEAAAPEVLRVLSNAAHYYKEAQRKSA